MSSRCRAGEGGLQGWPWRTYPKRQPRTPPHLQPFLHRRGSGGPFIGLKFIQHNVGSMLPINTLNTKGPLRLKPNQLTVCSLERGECAQVATTQRASFGNLIATGNGHNHHVASDLWRPTFFNAIGHIHASDIIVAL